MKLNKTEISICLCTYKRPAMLTKCLESLLNQSIELTYEVVVVDNDVAGTAESTVEQFRAAFQARGCNFQYAIEPQQNIALARNKAVSMASGEYIAFLDDDEEAEKDWLESLLNTLISERCDAVFGPILRLYTDDFPKSLIGAGIFEDPRMRETGSIIGGTGGRTSNGLVKRSVMKTRPGPFEIKLGRTGGEDTEFFCWLEQEGYSFRWCNKAIVRETISTERARFRYNFKRGYSAGWLKAKTTLTSARRFRSVVRLLSGAVLGFIRSIVVFMFHLTNPRAATVKLIRSVGSQAGKFGFLFGIYIEQYRE